VSAHERERLSAYLDGELTAGERARVETHLGACSECTALLADLGVADRAAAVLPVEAPDGYFDGFAERVVGRIEARKAEARPRRLPAWSWAVAAAVLLGVVTPLTLRQLRPGAVPVAAPAGSLTREAAERTPAPGAPEVASPPSRPSDKPPSPLKGRQDEAGAQNAFSREPAASPLPAAVAVEVEVEEPEAMADAAIAQAPRGAVAVAPPAAHGRGEPDLRRATAAETPSARSAESGGVAVGDAAATERAFLRLAAVRPRSADDWRRLRDSWGAFVAAHPDDPRADEARVRAIEAGHQAWLTDRDPDDEATFRRDARGYLERPDARQAERVRQMLSPGP